MLQSHSFAKVVVFHFRTILVSISIFLAIYIRVLHTGRRSIVDLDKLHQTQVSMEPIGVLHAT